MSSESDSEEFYDAADDISPSKNNPCNVIQKSNDAEQPQETIQLPTDSDAAEQSPIDIHEPSETSASVKDSVDDTNRSDVPVQQTESLSIADNDESVHTPEKQAAPVAPPRRKRKQKKDTHPKETDEATTPTQDKGPPQLELTENKQPDIEVTEILDKVIQHRNNLPADGVESDEPCIYIAEHPNDLAMQKVLVRGNSLDVVFNDDLAERKSGISPSKLFKSIDEASALEGSAQSTSKLVRCNSISGRPLSDIEILEQVVVTNLDTGERIPLSLAEDKIPKATNPLALHIMRLTSEFSSDQNLADDQLSDSSTVSSVKGLKRKKLKHFLGKTVQKIKLKADEVKARREESSSSEDEEGPSTSYIKLKSHRAIRERSVFHKVRLLQDLSGEHIGAIWTMKFSLCGRLLATAGQDNIVRIWVLKDACNHFEEMRAKYSKQVDRSSSPTSSINSMASNVSMEEEHNEDNRSVKDEDPDDLGPFRRIPFCTYHGHTADVLDISWSKNYFILSSSMDKTVRLWHISRQECLCCFQHVDFVTAIGFHPRDDRYFLSGSLDGKLRLWNIPEKKVALWNEIDGGGNRLITAANFCQDGKLAVVGTYDGRCIFYDTERLKYHTQVTVRSTRGKNSRGRKISGIEPMPGEDKVLVTSNDSRIRLYDLKDHSLYCKYKGSQNVSSQIRASFSNNGKYMLCGSEDHFVYIWRTYHDVPNARKDRNEYYECFSAHDAVVTAAMFVPIPSLIVPQTDETADRDVEVIASADWTGSIKLFVNG